MSSSSLSDSGQNSLEEWPADHTNLEAARRFLAECVSSCFKTLLVPDKDADGLFSAMIVYRTLVHLGLPSTMIHMHFLSKGSNVHTMEERQAISSHDARRVILLDHGSRGGRSIVDGDDVKTLIVDHHWSEDFPDDALVLSSAHHPPIAPTSTLTYSLCRPMVVDPLVQTQLEYLCVVGTMGDLGTAFKWEPPFPDMRHCIKKYTKKCLGEVVSLINAPRRTARYDVVSAWNALLESNSPTHITTCKTSTHVTRLNAARAEVRAEVDRCARSPPIFAQNGRVALIRISSAAQIHPLIATRWASSLKGPRLQMVMCANDGYSEAGGVTNFACRVARCANTRGEVVDLIELLKEYAGRVEGLTAKLGDDFGRGHQQASGGIVCTEDFEQLWGCIRDEGSDRLKFTDKKAQFTSTPAMNGNAGQKNTLDGWLNRTAP